MIHHDAQLARLLTPHLERVLVLDASVDGAWSVREMLSDLGAVDIEVHATNILAIEALKRFDPRVVLTELNGPDLDGLEFIRALRRGELPCRQAPVIVTAIEADSAAILAARHAGAHEFLKKPYAVKDLTRRLDAAILRQRVWIEAVTYIGPDRRRFNSGDYVGPRKRQDDNPPVPDKERITQALKILRAVIPAIETDPTQAFRAMRAQSDELQQVALAASDVRLMAAVGALRQCLTSAKSSGRLWRPDVEASAERLWPFLAEADAKPMAQAI